MENGERSWLSNSSGANGVDWEICFEDPGDILLAFLKREFKSYSISSLSLLFPASVSAFAEVAEVAPPPVVAVFDVREVGPVDDVEDPAATVLVEAFFWSSSELESSEVVSSLSDESEDVWLFPALFPETDVDPAGGLLPGGGTPDWGLEADGGFLTMVSTRGSNDVVRLELGNFSCSLSDSSDKVGLVKEPESGTLKKSFYVKFENILNFYNVVK